MKDRLEALWYLHRIFDELRALDRSTPGAPPSQELTQLLSGELSLEGYLESRFEHLCAGLTPALDEEDLAYVRQTCLEFAQQQVLFRGSFRVLRESLRNEGQLGHKKEGAH